MMPPAVASPAGARRLGAGRRVAVPPSASVSVARGVVVVTTAGGDDRPEERHRQADDRAPADEVTPIDAALGVRLDQVELLWADRATCSVEALPIHALPFVQLAGDVLVGTPGRPNPNGGLLYGQPPFPVRVYRKWHHDGHGSVRERPGAESGRWRRGCGLGRRVRGRPGRERGGADRRRVGGRQWLRRRDRGGPRSLARRTEAGRAIRGAVRRTGRVVGRRRGGTAAGDAWRDRDRRRRRQRARHRQAGRGRRHGSDGRRALRARRQPAARPPPDDRHPHHRRHRGRGDAHVHRDRPRRAQGVDVGRRAAARSGGARSGVDGDDARPRDGRHRPRRVRACHRSRQRAPQPRRS